MGLKIVFTEIAFTVTGSTDGGYGFYTDLVLPFTDSLGYAENAVFQFNKTPSSEADWLSEGDDDTSIIEGDPAGSVTFTIQDGDGVDLSDFEVIVGDAIQGGSILASIFPNGASVSTLRMA